MWLGKILRAIGEELEHFDSHVVKLLNEAIPGLSRELLPEWEQDLGLPDLCSALATSDEERAAIAHAKYTGKYSGMGKNFYIDYAGKLGATVTITEYIGAFSVFRVNRNRVDRTPDQGIDGARLRSKTSKFKWVVNVYSLGAVSLNYLECIFNELKPAHTQVIFNDLT